MATYSEIVQDAYRTVLGRDAEEAGLKYWVGELETGKIKTSFLNTALAAGAIDTDEAGGNQDVARADQYLTEKINTAYNQILGRDAKQEGIDYWAKDMIKGNISLDQLNTALFTSAQALPTTSMDYSPQLAIQDFNMTTTLGAVRAEAGDDSIVWNIPTPTNPVIKGVVGGTMTTTDTTPTTKLPTVPIPTSPVPTVPIPTSPVPTVTTPPPLIYTAPQGPDLSGLMGAISNMVAEMGKEKKVSSKTTTGKPVEKRGVTLSEEDLDKRRKIVSSAFLGTNRLKTTNRRKG